MIPSNGKAEFSRGLEPNRIERVARAPEVVEHAQKILPDEMRQHEAVVQVRAPAHGRAALRIAPEPRGERAQKQLLGEAHARVRRHLEGAELDKPETPRHAVGRIELVDADLGAMRVAGEVDEQIAKQPVGGPQRRVGARRRNQRQRDFEVR